MGDPAGARRRGQARAGGIERWLPQWDALYRRELRQAEDGRWVARTSRAACEEDLDDMIARDWKEAWRPLAMPTLLVRSTVPTNGGFIVPESERDGLLARAAQPTLAEVDATHSDIMTDDATWAAVDAHLTGLSLLEAVVVLVAGVAAGTINTVVGSGTLITFPVLLAVGYSPVTANVSNTIGLVPGSVSGAIGYRRGAARPARPRAAARRLLADRRDDGRGRLLILPDDLFKAIVPVFIAVALVLIVLQPRARQAARRARAAARPRHGAPACSSPASTAATSAPPRASCCSASSASPLPEALQRINALKNVLAGLVNGVAGVIFVFAAHVAWLPVALIAAGATAAAQLGARYGRRLPPAALRGLIVVVGTVAIVRLL